MTPALRTHTSELSSYLRVLEGIDLSHGSGDDNRMNKLTARGDGYCAMRQRSALVVPTDHVALRGRRTQGKDLADDPPIALSLVAHHPHV